MYRSTSWWSISETGGSVCTNRREHCSFRTVWYEYHTIRCLHITLSNVILGISGGGSGGSIFIKVSSSVAGNGQLFSNGGQSMVSSGSGGRIAIHGQSVETLSVSVSGGSRYALSFDGYNDYVTIPVSINQYFSRRVISLEGWFFMSTCGYFVALVGHTSRFAIFCNNVQLSAGNSNTRTPDVAYPENTWIHLAATYDLSTISLFVNGILASYVAYKDLMNTPSSSTWVMGRHSDSSYYYTGSMESIRIWNIALSPAAIISNKDGVSFFSEGLVAAYFSGQTLSAQSNAVYNTGRSLDCSFVNFDFTGGISSFVQGHLGDRFGPSGTVYYESLYVVGPSLPGS